MMADYNLSYTGTQLDAAITLALSGGGGGSDWTNETGEGTADGSGNLVITGMAITPKVVFFAVTDGGTDANIIAEYIDEVWYVSMFRLMWRTDASAMVSFADGTFTLQLMATPSSPFKYSAWG